MKTFTRLLLGLFLIFSFSHPSAFSADDYEGPFYLKRQQEKAKTRWNLADWIDQRDRMRMMDLWLALHSSSPYEFFLGGDFQFGKLVDHTAYSGGSGFFAAYARIFGVQI